MLSDGWGMNNIVVFVDENYESRRVNGRALNEMFDGGVEVISIPPEKNIAKMLQKISGYGKMLVSLVLDEHLLTDGKADFYGTQFVDEYRKYDDKLPIYILTSHNKEMNENIGSVEIVMSKDDVSEDNDKRAALAERMIRRISNFSEICDERVVRIRGLLLKSLSSALSDDEAKELSHLFMWKSGAAIEGEFEAGALLKDDLDAREAKIMEIEGLLDSKGW